MIDWRRLNETPRVHDLNGITELRNDAEIVGNQNDRRAALGRKAVEQFKAYLDFSPGAEDVASVRGMIEELEREPPAGAAG